MADESTAATGQPPAKPSRAERASARVAEILESTLRAQSHDHARDLEDHVLVAMFQARDEARESGGDIAVATIVNTMRRLFRARYNVDTVYAYLNAARERLKRRGVLSESDT